MNFKNTITIFIALIIALSICSCGFDESESKIRGGELLNGEKLSEIKDKILSTESDPEQEMISDTSDYDEEKSSQFESEDSCETDINSVTEKQDEFSSEINHEVYWLEGGSVWHASPKCRYLENTEYISGTVDEAKEAGKSKVCSSCGK